MVTVTLPNGKVYNFAARNVARARQLADRTGGTLSTGTRTRRDLGYGWTDGRNVCPHGDSPNYCDRGGCDEGW